MSNRVLHVVESLNHSTGGPSQSVPSLLISRRNAGYQDLIATTHFNKDDRPIEYLKNSYYAFCGKLRFSPCLIFELISNRHNYDIIHINCIWNLVFLSSFIIGKLYKKKIILSTRGMLRIKNIKESMLKQLIIFIFKRLIFNYIDCFHVTSEWEKDDLITLGINCEKIHLIFNLSRKSWKNSKIKNKASNNELFTFLYVGRMHPYKRVVELIDAYISLSKEDLLNTRLILIGPSKDDNYMKEIEKKIAEQPKGIDIKLLGFIDGPDLKKYYSTSSVLVMPSKSENFGMSIFEALHYNKPVIVPEISPWPSLLPKNVMDVVSEDASNLKDCLKRSKDKIKSQKLDFTKLEKVLKQYTDTSILQEYNNLYNRI